MQLSQKINRKKFLKIVSYALILPFIYGWISMLRQNRLLQLKSATLTLPADLPDGLSFVEPVIIHKNSGRIEIYSARCTHLGCMINHIEDDHLVCPCHGSEFLSDGNVSKGPAKKPLRKLNYTFDKEKEQIIVKLT